MDAQVQDPADQVAARTHPPSMVDPVPMAGRVVMVEQATQAMEVAVVLLLLEAHQHPSVAEVDEAEALPALIYNWEPKCACCPVRIRADHQHDCCTSSALLTIRSLAH